MHKASVRLALAALFAHAGVATAAPAATIKREIPLHQQTWYLKGTPIALGTEAKGMAYDGLQLWVANYDSDTVQRIDAVNNQVKQTIALPAGSNPSSVVFDGTYVWVVTGSARAFKFSTSGVQQGSPVALSSGAWGAAFDGDSLWVSTGLGVDRVRASNGTRTTFPASVLHGAVAFDGRNVWVAESGQGLCKLDGVSGAELFFDPAVTGPSSVNGVAFDGRSIWVIAGGDAVARKFDIETNALLATVSTYPDPRAIAYDGRYLWITSFQVGTVIQVDVRTNQIADAIDMPAGLRSYNAVYDGTFVWVNGRLNEADSALYKLLVRR